MMNPTGSNPQQTLPFKSTESQERCEPKTSPTQKICLKAFELDGVVYVRVIPGKKLFNSTMVHSVVNRGDIFALRLEDSVFTIIPGTAKVRHFDIEVQVGL
jgi:hypothetical protein